MRSRNVLLDRVKGYAILLVIAGHCIQFGSGKKYIEFGAFFDNVLYKIIYSFHMPLFALVSGYFFFYSIKKHNTVQLLKSKIISILCPLLFWGFVQFAYSVLKPMIFSNSKANLIELLEIYIDVLMNGFWFLWGILWCSVIVIIVSKLLRDNIVIYCAIIFLSFFVTDDYNLMLYKFIFPFFVMGYLCLAKDFGKKLVIIKSKYFLPLCLLVYIVLMFFYDKDSYIYVSGYAIMGLEWKKHMWLNIYRFIVGIVGSVLFIKVLMWTKEIKFITRFIAFLGTRTRDIYIISTLLFNNVVARKTASIDGFNILTMIVELLIITFISVLVTEAISISKRYVKQLKISVDK